jgi:hypothetical protein
MPDRTTQIPAVVRQRLERIAVADYYDANRDAFETVGTKKEDFLKAFDACVVRNPDITAEEYLQMCRSRSRSGAGPQPPPLPLADEAAKVDAYVKKFAEDYPEDFARAGVTREEYQRAFKALRKKDPGLTAEQYRYPGKARR